MSLLLEALKKAALEKQSRAEQSDATETAAQDQDLAQSKTDAAEPSFGDTLQQEDNVAPVPEPEEELTAESEVALSGSEDEFEFSEEIEEEESQPDSSPIALNDPENAADEELTFEPEFEDDSDNLDEATPIEQIDEQIEEQKAEPLQESFDEDENANEGATTSAEIIIDEAEVAATREQIEQEDLLAEQRIRDEERLEEERQRIVLAAEEERLRQEEAEAARANEIAAQERKRQELKSRDALDQLITSGKEIQRKARRRSAFLYSLLVLTAVGGLSAYYVFLIANTGKRELQVAPIIQPNPDITDVAVLVQLTPEQILEDTSRTSGPEAGTANVSPPAPEVISAEQDANTEALEGRLGDVDPPADETGTSPEGLDAAPAGQTSTARPAARAVATRVDPPPSATAYLQPLILSAEGKQQTTSLAERVIIHHKAEPTRTSDLVREAYQALQANRLDEADRLYRSVLKQAPDHRDALLGAAASAKALGNFDDAIAFYQRRLEKASDDTFARAGLLGLASSEKSRGSVQQEVNALLKENPDSAQLHFVKGVGLAAATQWSGAQSAFYQAYSLDNKNPDYAFNLAVSLDRLRQPALARVYYERALELSRDRKPFFELAAAERRVTELTSP